MSAAQITCLTPPGSAAIAVLEVSGPDAWSITQRLFRSASGNALPTEPTALSTWFGRIGPGAGDEAILAVPSIHPHPLIEIHGHGGRQVVRMILDLFKEEGCEEREQALEPNKAWNLLPHAKTLRTAAILLDQANGAFERATEAIRVEIASGNMAAAQSLLDALTGRIELGRHLVEPWRVVIAGAPNAGKSSLLNALAGYQRSVVAPIPGTTRDVVTTTLAFDGFLVELSDTAGLRTAGDELEREGVERAQEQIQKADLCLWVIDTTSTLPDRAELRLPSERVLPVLNKIDQPAAWDLSSFADGVKVSATTGFGLAELIGRIVAILVPEPPPPGAGVPFDDGCVEVIETMPLAVSG